MKTIGLIIISFILSVSAQSQSAYEKAMQNGLDSLNNIQSSEGFQSVANHFERIAKQESQQWLPSYYAAYCYIILSFNQQDVVQKESYIEKAAQLIDGAIKVAPDESELYVLKGMQYQAIITIDPMTNGQIYMQPANEAFQKALELNADNPRAYYLLASNIMYTPEQFGGGIQAACPTFQKAKELYDKETENGQFMPVWGKQEVEGFAGQCSAE